MRKTLSHLVDLKSAVTSITVLFVALAAVYSQMDHMADEAAERIYAHVTAPTYAYVKYDLLKQLEKLQKDPDDIKRQDIVKFTYFCDGYFGSVYITSQATLDARNLQIACEKITDIYDEG